MGSKASEKVKYIVQDQTEGWSQQVVPEISGATLEFVPALQPESRKDQVERSRSRPWRASSSLPFLSYFPLQYLWTGLTSTHASFVPGEVAAPSGPCWRTFEGGSPLSRSVFQDLGCITWSCCSRLVSKSNKWDLGMVHQVLSQRLGEGAMFWNDVS